MGNREKESKGRKGVIEQQGPYTSPVLTTYTVEGVRIKEVKGQGSHPL